MAPPWLLPLPLPLLLLLPLPLQLLGMLLMHPLAPSASCSSTAAAGARR
jgi:hypothetical protein